MAIQPWRIVAIFPHGKKIVNHKGNSNKPGQCQTPHFNAVLSVGVFRRDHCQPCHQNILVLGKTHIPQDFRRSLSSTLKYHWPSDSFYGQIIVHRHHSCCVWVSCLPHRHVLLREQQSSMHVELVYTALCAQTVFEASGPQRRSHVD